MFWSANILWDRRNERGRREKGGARATARRPGVEDKPVEQIWPHTNLDILMLLLTRLRSSPNSFVHLSILSTLLLAAASGPSMAFSSLSVTVVGANDFYSQSRTVRFSLALPLPSCRSPSGPE